MRKLMVIVVALAGAVPVLAAQPAQAQAGRHCSNVYYHPMYTTVKHVRARHMRCKPAQDVIRSWFKATTSTTGPHGTRTGHCFTNPYGTCRVRSHHRRYTCHRSTPGRHGTTLYCRSGKRRASGHLPH